MLPLIKYELKEIKHKKILLITLALFIFGVQQILWSNKIDADFHLDLVTYLKNAWLPVNFIYVPLLLIFSDILTSRFSVIDALPVSKEKITLSKVISCYVIGGIFYLLSLLVLLGISIINRLEPAYYLPYILQYSLNFFLTLTFLIGVSLCIGRFFKWRFLRYLISIIIFLLICNFYTEASVLLPIYYVDIISSTFELISVNKVFINHIIILTIINILLFLIGFIRSRDTIKIIPIVVVLIGISEMIYSNTEEYLPREYSIKYDNIGENYIENKFEDGYLIEKYDMNINLNENFSSQCIVDIKGAKGSEITLYLYENLKVTKVTIDGKEASYERVDDKLKVKLNGKEDIKLLVEYEGVINTKDAQGAKKYFVNNDSAFIGDFFEWYPKGLNRSNKKEYKIKINTNDKNSIYSNLKKDGNGIYSGVSKDAFIVKGKIYEAEYNGVKFVGNLEQINSDEKLNSLYSIVNDWTEGLLNEKATLILTPKTDKQYLINDIYGDVILFGEFDRETIIAEEELE